MLKRNKRKICLAPKMVTGLKNLFCFFAFFSFDDFSETAKTFLGPATSSKEKFQSEILDLGS